MIGRKILAAGLTTLALFAAGCGSDTGSTPTADAGTTDTPSGGDGGGSGGQTYDYVISNLTLDNSMTAPNAGARGYNIDNRNTGATPSDPLDCDKSDFFSPIDSDQNMGTCTAGQANGGASCRGGVDNQLPVVAETVSGLVSGTDVGALIQEQITEGKLAIIVRVEGVNGTPGPTLNDDNVTVKIYPFAHPMFANCSQVGQPGQMYQIDPDSVMGGNVNMARYTYSGRIVNGRLQVNTSTNLATPGFSIGIPVQDRVLNLNLYAVQVRVTMGATAGTNGNLGGMILLSDLVTTLQNAQGLLPAGIDPATVQGILAGFVDIATGSGNMPGAGSCTGANAGGIGAGLGFTTTSAVIAPTVAARPTSGTCGASGSSGDAGR